MDPFEEWLSEPQTRKEYEEAVRNGETVDFRRWANSEFCSLLMYGHHSIGNPAVEARVNRLAPFVERHNREIDRELKTEQAKRAAKRKKHERQTKKLIAKGRAFKSRGKSPDALSKELLKLLPASNAEVFRRLSPNRVIQEVNREFEVVHWKSARGEKETSFASITKHRLPNLRKKITPA